MKQNSNILVAENNPSVRRAMVKVLRREAYELMAAPDGAQALYMASRRRGTIDLLIANVLLPKIDGIELAKTITGVRPEMAVLIIYKDLPALPHTFAMLKPGEPQAFLNKVKALLAPHPSASYPHAAP